MLISFRQTYGNERHMLYDILSRDHKLIELYNLCDYNIISFHNSTKETIDYYKKINPVKNSVYLEFNDIGFGETIRLVREKLIELGATHFFWTQDDSFSYENEYFDWSELIRYAKSKDKDFMIALSRCTYWIDPRIPPSENLNSFNIFFLTTRHYDNMPFQMDDTPYICTMDMFDEIYDNEYYKIDNVWECERYLQKKFHDKEIPRHVVSDTNIPMLNYNILGKTLDEREKNIEILKEKDLWPNISSNIA